MSKKPYRNKTKEAEQRQEALNWLMFWCFKIEQKHQEVLKGLQSRKPKTYEDKIALACLLKQVHEAHHFDVLEELDIHIFLYPDYMNFVLHKLYYAELHFNPWGFLIQCLSGRVVINQKKTLLSTKLPNFLLPTSCAYCGKDLGFKSYKDTSIKMTKHKECANSWNKGTRVKHLNAFEALHGIKGFDHRSTEAAVAFDKLWQSYVDLVPLYKSEYIPRYKLIDAYKDIPVGDWFEPLSGSKDRHLILELPFMDPEVKNYALSLSKDDEGFPLQNSKNSKQTVILEELDAYFLENP